MNRQKTKRFWGSTSKQEGFTLVELMVSLAIGLTIVLFVSSIYVSSAGSFRLSDANARLQEDGHAVMHLLGRNVMQSGYGNLVWQNPYVPTDFVGMGLHGCDNGFERPGTFVSDSPATCATSGTPAFEVSYRVDDAVNATIGAGADCNGQAVPSAGGTRIVVNRFYLARRSGGNNLTLYCAGNGNSIAQPVMENVEAMHLTYGIDNDGDGSVDQFLTSAAAVDALGPDIPESWKKVVSVNLCLQMSSASNAATGVQAYVDCAGTERATSDRRLRAVLSGTFTRRNRL